jgi:hypothetical protein
VNCYKTDDWMLGLMYRSKAWEVGVAGLAPVLLHGPRSSASDGDGSSDSYVDVEVHVDVDEYIGDPVQDHNSSHWDSSNKKSDHHMATERRTEQGQEQGQEYKGQEYKGQEYKGQENKGAGRSRGPLVHLLPHDPAWRTEVENIDVGALVGSHLLYGDCLRAILARVGLPAAGE